MSGRVIVLGWDSATFDVIDPLVAGGRLPALASLIATGFSAPLRSTWPPMTDCAWTSAFTGRNPGAHGIFGSWYRAPGAYRCRYFSSRDRRAPALWEMTDGVPHVVWNVPMTFPPSELIGAMVAGYGAPPGSRFCEPLGLQGELAQRWPLDDLLDRAPHGSLERFLDELVRGVQAQAEALVWTAQRVDARSLVAVWPQVDRAQHFFWRFRGADHELAGAVELVYEAMDRATATVLEAFPHDDVLVVSDHGAGALHGDVNVAAWLTASGLARPGARRSSAVGLAWRLPPPVRKLARSLAPALARRAYGATLAGQLGPFDWSSTKAFMGFHGDLWLNLRGREPDGTVASEQADALLDEIAAAALELTDPRTGALVFAAVHKRDEVYSGPASDLAPDAVLDSWSLGYRVAPNRDPDAALVSNPSSLAGVAEAWSSDHRPLGIFVGAGPSFRSGSAPELSLYDVCPTVLALLGCSIPEELDGRPATAAFEPRWLERNPVRTRASAGPRSSAGRSVPEYSEDEAAAVAAHLKELGYIE